MIAPSCRRFLCDAKAGILIPLQNGELAEQNVKRSALPQLQAVLLTRQKLSGLGVFHRKGDAGLRNFVFPCHVIGDADMFHRQYSL